MGRKRNRRDSVKSQPGPQNRPQENAVARQAIDPTFQRRERQWAWAVCIGLVLAVFAVFGQTVGFDFINFDDDLCVYENPPVTSGLTIQGIHWAFTKSQAWCWQPVTWISFMLDREIFGLRPGGFHFTNVLLHAVTAVLLFLLLRKMTGRLWPCAFAAALFAVHPLRVESVAWVTERKDVLSGFFFMLTLWVYVRYARRKFSILRYAVVAVFFALGLMSKPILVTMPCLLLLLDYWPLQRIALPDKSAAVSFRDLAKTCAWLVAEKVPLLILVGVSCAMTVWAQGDALMPADQSSLAWRIGNAMLAYAGYLGHFVYPVDLAVIYPRRDIHLPLPMGQVLGAAAMLIGITAAVIIYRKRPYLPVGWFWYVGMLLPVIGLIQVGTAAEADRFTYLPQIGIGIAIAWGAADWTQSWPRQRLICSLAAAVVLLAAMIVAGRQTTFWRNSESLWTHTIACTPPNSLAHNQFADALVSQERLDEAVKHYEQAVAIEPNYYGTRNNIGLALAKLHRLDEAEKHLRKAIELKPDAVEAYHNLGTVLVSQGRVDDAILAYQTALQIQPDYALAIRDLGITLSNHGRWREALKYFERAIQFQSNNSEMHYNLGNVLVKLGQSDDAVAAYRKAVELSPAFAAAHNNLGILLLQGGHPDEAAQHLREAVRIQPDYVDAYGNLGVALIQLGKLDEAIQMDEKAVAIRPNDATGIQRLDEARVYRRRMREEIARYRQVLQTRPDNLDALNNLAWALATSLSESLRNGQEAVAFAERAKRIAGQRPDILDTLAAAYAEAGRFSEATAAAREAMELATRQGKTELADSLKTRLALYEAQKPFRSLQSIAGKEPQTPVK